MSYLVYLCANPVLLDAVSTLFSLVSPSRLVVVVVVRAQCNKGIGTTRFVPISFVKYILSYRVFLIISIESFRNPINRSLIDYDSSN